MFKCLSLFLSVTLLFYSSSIVSMEKSELEEPDTIDLQDSSNEYRSYINEYKFTSTATRHMHQFNVKKEEILTILDNSSAATIIEQSRSLRFQSDNIMFIKAKDSNTIIDVMVDESKEDRITILIDYAIENFKAIAKINSFLNRSVDNVSVDIKNYIKNGCHEITEFATITVFLATINESLPSVSRRKNLDLFSAIIILRFIRNSLSHPIFINNQIFLKWRLEDSGGKYTVKDLNIVFDVEDYKGKPFKFADIGGWSKFIELLEYIKVNLKKYKTECYRRFPI